MYVSAKSVDIWHSTYARSNAQVDITTVSVSLYYISDALVNAYEAMQGNSAFLKAMYINF